MGRDQMLLDLIGHATTSPPRLTTSSNNTVSIFSLSLSLSPSSAFPRAIRPHPSYYLVFQSVDERARYQQLYQASSPTLFSSVSIFNFLNKNQKAIDTRTKKPSTFSLFSSSSFKKIDVSIDWSFYIPSRSSQERETRDPIRSIKEEEDESQQ